MARSGCIVREAGARPLDEKNEATKPTAEIVKGKLAWQGGDFVTRSVI